MKAVTAKESSCTNYCTRSDSGMNKLGQTETTTWKYSGKTSKRVCYVSLVKNNQLVYPPGHYWRISYPFFLMRRDNVLGKKLLRDILKCGSSLAKEILKHFTGNRKR